MRVIAGKARGKRIDLPSKLSFRPTSDRARETLYNIISGHIEGAVFLDCFAGSGAVGLEAASRGAAKVYAVERYRRNCSIIKGNFASTGLNDRLQLICNDYKKALRKLHIEGQTFDIMFFDPPYFAGIYRSVLNLLYQYKSIASGLIILEHYKTTETGFSENFSRVKLSKVGDTHFSFLRIIDDEKD